MHWGHAVSKDLVRWRELPVALYPRQFGDWCFSGSAVVDGANTSGWRRGKGPLLVLAYTSTGRGECIAFSNDLGRTWSEYEGNPVIRHRGRDPKLFWHAPTRKWVMAVYDEGDGRARDVAFYTSPDLKKWQYQSRVAGFYECPDLFPLTVDGNAKNIKWVLSAADGKYLLGHFDGRTFTREAGKHQVWHGNFYAAQTFDGAPGDRRVQIGWGNGITFPGMPFNQQMTIACELTLRTTDEGVRCSLPRSRRLNGSAKSHAWKNLTLKTGDNPLAGVTGELLDVAVEFRPAAAGRMTLTVRRRAGGLRREEGRGELSGRPRLR